MSECIDCDVWMHVTKINAQQCAWQKKKLQRQAMGQRSFFNTHQVTDSILCMITSIWLCNNMFQTEQKMVTKYISKINLSITAVILKLCHGHQSWYECIKFNGGLSLYAVWMSSRPISKKMQMLASCQNWQQVSSTAFQPIHASVTNSILWMFLSM